VTKASPKDPVHK